MSGSTRLLILAVAVGLLLSYVLWGLPRAPQNPPENHVALTTTTSTTSTATTAPATIPRSSSVLPAPPPPRVSKLQLDPEEIDFGTVPMNESRTKAQKLTNVTGKTINIREIGGSCGCLTVEASGTEIPPGGNVTLNYRFAGTPGTKQITGHFRSDEESNPYTIVNVHAFVKQEIHVEPPLLNFDHVNKNEPKTLDFVVRSDDGKPFTIKSIAGSRQEYTFKWEIPLGGDGSKYTAHATLKSNKGGMMNDTAAVFTDRPKNGTMPLNLNATVTPDIVSEPAIVRTNADSMKKVEPFVAVIKRTTPGKLEINSIVEASPAPNTLPLDYEVERVSDEACRITIKLKFAYPKRPPFGNFLIKTNVEENDFYLPFRVTGIVGNPK